jgi:hypothetical protein
MCEAAVAEPDQVAVERGVKMAKDNTWDAIVRNWKATSATR